MNKKVTIAIISAFFALVLGCSKPLTPTYAGYKNLRLEKIGLKENILAAEVQLFNPNHYPLQVKSADVDLYLADRFVSKTKFDTLITMIPKDTTSIPLRLTLSAKDLLRNAGLVLLNPDIKVRIDGNVRAGRKGYFVNLPVNYEGTQRINLFEDSVNAIPTK